ncbi:hypothetical protein KY290_002259 [Solanum tuberosum]|uniref:NAC transcription factor n=2 Tax=Solanum tuberosum TaxID=4113 RepID=M0ZGR1_SOLTU|nr:hypothetical protein KY284_002314 [Solanum tuberosum]KAH0731232.1 hypothetical protein KY289_002420 [Solanum tuberosum]KAH0782661.1 hypothetical protein KY290_002259 [Solanum tuberosum]
MTAIHHRQRKRYSESYNFYPKESDVIKYLLGFAIDEPLPEQHQFMRLVDLYAEKEPWEILEGTNTNAGYFITPLKKEKPHHKRFKRIVGKGIWKIQDLAKKVFDDRGRLMGYVHHMKYTPDTNKKSIIKELFGEWLMTEYSLDNDYVTNMKKKIIYKDFVICKIKKKKQRRDHDDKGKDENIMNDVEVNELIDSVMEELEEIDDNIEVDVGDDFLAALENECMNSEDNEISKNDANDINLDEFDFF